MFILESGFKVNASMSWSFNLGNYRIFINGVAIYNGAKVSFHEVFKGTYRLTVFDYDGQAVADAAIKSDDVWDISVTREDELRLYHLDIRLSNEVRT